MNIAIITAAGIGKRMGDKAHKVMLSLADKPLIYWTIKKFQDSESIDDIVVVANKEDMQEIKDMIKRYGFTKARTVIEGGKERQDSVNAGLHSFDADDEDIVLIHNGANPFVSDKIIGDVIDATKEIGAAGPGIKAPDTVKEADDDGIVLNTLDRKRLWHMHTPQGIKYWIAKRAFEKAAMDNFYGTDDLTLVERIGKKAKIVESSEDNIKITYPYDLKFGNILKGSARVGIGQDSHRFTDEAKPLVLAGVTIGGRGLEANSDGDVVLHALFNAISSSIGEKPFSYHADEMCEQGIKDSKEYIKVIAKKLNEREYAINNIGIALECKTPNIRAVDEKLKESLSSILGIDKENIGITATSGEGLTEFGKGEGIQCFAIVGVKKR